MYKKAMLELCVNKRQEIIVDYLCHTTKDRRVERKELVSVLHVSDRQVRRDISDMRMNGIPIASTVDKAGYFIPKNMKEFNEFSSRYLHRANTLYRIEKKMRDNAFKMYNGQVNMGELK